ncbi:MAG: sulfur carrier protein ThiS [Proteobacteria bacterium]|nr:sulfur carrier protein ThiS [Pseudomonadota bacterium]MBU1686046.1 sulfur carrier protein ThiS [Pseudomonadota bacterium]
MEIQSGTTIEGLILGMDLNPDTVVVECDGQIVLREEYGNHVLNTGSRVELIRFVGGG